MVIVSERAPVALTTGDRRVDGFSTYDGGVVALARATSMTG